MARRYRLRLQNTGELIKGVVAFGILEAKAAAAEVANKMGQAVAIVEADRRPPKRARSRARASTRPPAGRAMKPNPYGIRKTMSGAAAPMMKVADRGDAFDVAQQLANDTGDSFTVFDMDSFPRAKSIQGSRKPSKAKGGRGQAEALQEARRVANSTGRPVVLRWTDEAEARPKPKPKRRAAVKVAAGRAPANKRRPRKRGLSKLQALAGLF